MQTIAPELAPLVAAIALSSIIVLISTSFTKMNKMLFQATLFATVIAGGIAYVISNQDPNLVAAWTLFVRLSVETRFCLSLVLVGTVYFGGAMYIAAPEEAEIVAHHAESASPAHAAHVFDTPASVDTSVTFDVPATLPADDKVFFEEMLDK